MSTVQLTVLLPANGPEFDEAARIADAAIRRMFPAGGTRIGSITQPVVYGWYRPTGTQRREWDRTLMVTIATDIPDGDPKRTIARLVRELDNAYDRYPIWQDTYSISVVPGYFRFPSGRRPVP